MHRFWTKRNRCGRSTAMLASIGSSSSGSNSKITIIKEGETMKPKPFADSAQHRLVAFAYISLVAHMRLVKTAR